MNVASSLQVFSVRILRNGVSCKTAAGKEKRPQGTDRREDAQWQSSYLSLLSHSTGLSVCVLLYSTTNQAKKNRIFSSEVFTLYFFFLKLKGFQKDR